MLGLSGKVDEDDLGRSATGERQFEWVGDPGLVAGGQRFVTKRDLALDDVEEDAATRLDLVRDLMTGREMADEESYILMNPEGSGQPGAGGDRQEPARPLLLRELFLLV